MKIQGEWQVRHELKAHWAAPKPCQLCQSTQPSHLSFDQTVRILPDGTLKCSIDLSHSNNRSLHPPASVISNRKKMKWIRNHPWMCCTSSTPGLRSSPIFRSGPPSMKALPSNVGSIANLSIPWWKPFTWKEHIKSIRVTAKLQSEIVPN